MFLAKLHFVLNCVDRPSNNAFLWKVYAVDRGKPIVLEVLTRSVGGAA